MDGPLQIRPKAICAFRHGERILVAHGYDARRAQRYARPLGGTIEFGERAEEALRREIREEIGAEIRLPRLRGVLENVFTLEGRPSHEILFVFDAEFEDPRHYAGASIPLQEVGWDGDAEWVSLDSFRQGSTPLYPEGLMALLDR